MKYFSMFSGIGGMENGIDRAFLQETKAKDIQKECSCTSERQAGATCIGYSEIDKYASAIYQYHYKGHKNYGDATRLVPKELPDFDLLVGGFPCQAFSIAGKRKGFDDTRGTLFFEIARVLRDKRPRYFLLENVKGLLSHDNGKTFATILGVLSEIGYDIQWQVLNSKNFGVPQNRERVFIVGCLGRECRRQVFPIGESSELYNEENGTKERQAQAEISGAIKGSNMKADHTFISEKISKPLTATCYKGVGNDGTTLIKSTQKLSDAHRIRNTDGCSVTLKGEGGGQGAKTGLYVVPVLTPDRKEKRQNGRRFKENGDPSFTLTGQDVHGVCDGSRIRRLTPVECCRLQGFPDDWCDKGFIDGKIVDISDSQKYKCLGNAVTTTVIEHIIRRIYGIN